MLNFPNCKINLGLNIVAKRADGYHDLETVFYPIPFCDALEIIEDKTDTGKDVPGINFNTSGLAIPGSSDNNLCIKAYRLLQKDFPDIPPIQMHLHKTIPMGAGLGGGSSDGAFTLQLLNKKFELELDDERLSRYALQLGSDSPFFILNKPCYATGRGEQLQPLDLELKGYTLVLVNPGIHVATAAAFAAIRPQQPALNCKTIVRQPIDTWKDALINDFEAGVFALYPELAGIKTALYHSGAVYASMTGTGSTIYGLFANPPAALPAFGATTMVKQLSL